MSLNSIFLIFFFIFALEILVLLLTFYLKKDFQWIITKADEIPKFDKEKLRRFFEKSYSEQTGWDRRPGTSGYEISGLKKTKFNISNHGFRNNTNNYKKTKFLVFGDSFAFCRYVNDDETWEHYLENLINSSVRNYGVGNFGVDQAIIKYNNLKNEDEANNIILSFVPETILRVHSYWKHYIEFGNHYGFKPKYKLSNNKLEILPNVLKKNDQLEDLNSKIEYIQKNDIFYNNRFKRMMFKFPFILSYLRNFNRNNVIFFNILFFKIFKILNLNKQKKFYEQAKYRIIQENINLSHKMYQSTKYSKLLEEILKDFNLKIKSENKNLWLIVFPQIQDLKAIKKNRVSYQIFYENLKLKMNVIDLTDYFISYGNYKSLYTDDIYGGHLSAEGNKFVANILKNELINLN